MTKFPVEGQTEEGALVRLYPTKGDMSVTQYADATGDRAVVTTHYSHHPHAIERFQALTGQTLSGLTSDYQKVKDYPNKPEDGHEHDWEWVNPDDDDDMAVTCSLCGTAGEAEE